MTDFGRRAGVGDMLKSVYDQDEDGTVDDAEKLEGSSKAGVQDHAPQTHGHAMPYITGLILALAGKSATGHAHTESEILDLNHDAQKIKGVIVDDSDKGDSKVLAYNATSENLEYETAAAGGGGGKNMGSFSRSSAGNEVITGLGFTPSWVFFLAVTPVPAEKNFSVGVDYLIARMCIRNFDGTSQITAHQDRSITIRRITNNWIMGHVTVFAANGFTVAFTSAGTATADVYWMAFE